MHLERRCLWRGEELVDLAYLPACVLAYLIELEGEVALRSDLRDRFWGRDTIGFDDRLNTCVRAIRVALGDDAAAPRYIETVRGRGYRFVGRTARPAAVFSEPVAAAPPEPWPDSIGPAPGTGALAATTAAGRGHPSAQVGVLAGTCAVALLVLTALAGHRDGTRSGEVRAVPTTDAAYPEAVPEAIRDTAGWAAYLRASVVARDAGAPELHAAARLYQEAISRDPGFASGYTGLSLVRSELGWRRQDPALLGSARRLAGEAASRSGGSGEGALALGVSYLFERRWDEAIRELERARRDRPRDPRVLSALGEAQRRTGRWSESNATFEHLVALDPFSARAPLHLAFNHGRLRDYTRAERHFVRAIALDPAHAETHLRRAVQRLRWTGRPGEAMDLLVEAAARTGQPIEALVRSVRELGRVLGPELTARQSEAQPRPDMVSSDMDGVTLRLSEGWILLREGRLDEARSVLSRLVADLRPGIGDAGEWIGVPTRQGTLGLALALLGKDDEARERADAILAEFPPDRDACTSAYLRVIAAEILATIGDVDRAFDLVVEQLARPSTLSREMLRVDPIWEPLRRHPEWSVLLGEP